MPPVVAAAPVAVLPGVGAPATDLAQVAADVVEAPPLPPCRMLSRPRLMLVFSGNPAGTATQLANAAVSPVGGGGGSLPVPMSAPAGGGGDLPAAAAPVADAAALVADAAAVADLALVSDVAPVAAPVGRGGGVGGDVVAPVVEVAGPVASALATSPVADVAAPFLSDGASMLAPGLEMPLGCPDATWSATTEHTSGPRPWICNRAVTGGEAAICEPRRN